MIEFYNSRRRELTAEHSSLPDIEIYSDLNSRSAMLSSACLNTSVAVPEEREREKCLTPVQSFALGPRSGLEKLLHGPRGVLKMIAWTSHQRRFDTDGIVPDAPVPIATLPQ